MFIQNSYRDKVNSYREEKMGQRIHVLFFKIMQLKITPNI